MLVLLVNCSEYATRVLKACGDGCLSVTLKNKGDLSWCFSADLPKAESCCSLY